MILACCPAALPAFRSPLGLDHTEVEDFRRLFESWSFYDQRARKFSTPFTVSIVQTSVQGADHDYGISRLSISLRRMSLIYISWDMQFFTFVTVIDRYCRRSKSLLRPAVQLHLYVIYPTLSCQYSHDLFLY